MCLDLSDPAQSHTEPYSSCYPDKSEQVQSRILVP